MFVSYNEQVGRVSGGRDGGLSTSVPSLPVQNKNFRFGLTCGREV